MPCELIRKKENHFLPATYIGVGGSGGIFSAFWVGSNTDRYRRLQAFCGEGILVLLDRLSLRLWDPQLMLLNHQRMGSRRE